MFREWPAKLDSDDLDGAEDRPRDMLADVCSIGELLSRRFCSLRSKGGSLARMFRSSRYRVSLVEREIGDIGVLGTVALIGSGGAPSSSNSTLWTKAPLE